MVPVAIRRPLLVCTAALAATTLALSVVAAPAPGTAHVTILGLGMISFGVMRLRWLG